MRDLKFTGPVELKVPAQKNSMLIIRLTAAGVIARAGLTVDRLDDAKMAIEEACTCLIEASDPPKCLKLTFTDAGDGLHILICGDCDCGGQSVEGDELNVVRCILESLADGVEIRGNGGRLSEIELKILPCVCGERV